MDPARDEASRVAGALILCVIDRDQEGAGILLRNTSPPVLAQVCAYLAVYLVDCADDTGAMRAELAGALQA
jgi:hypothetical protein